MTTPEEIRLALANRIASVGDSVLDSTSPLYAEISGGRLRFLGSTFLLGVESERFLITAGHVLDEVGTDRIYAGGTSLVESGGTWLHTRPPVANDRDTDPNDVAVLHLGENVCKALDLVPLLPNQSDPSAKPGEDGHYMAVGFPSSRQSVWIRDGGLSPKQLYLTGHEAPLPPIERAHFHADRNFAMEFDKADMVDFAGKTRAAPDPVGMSGGPVLVTEGIAGTRPLRWRLAGVGIVWRQDQAVIVGTRIGLCFDAILERCPQLGAFIPTP